MTLRNPVVAWRAGTRWPLLSLGLLLALVLAVGACEALGWPFLVAPLEKTLSGVLHRKVVMGSASDATESAQIRLIGSVRLKAPLIEIASPDWSDAPHMLKAQGAYLKLGYLDLWRAWRGAPINVKELEAVQLDANLARRKDGLASWQFGDPAKEKPASESPSTPPALPTFDSLRVDSGHLAYQDAVTPADIDANFALRDSSRSDATDGGSKGLEIEAGADAEKGKAPPVELAPGEVGFKLKAVGKYQKLPLRIDLATSGALALLAEGESATAQPVKLAAKVGPTELSFDGSTTDPLHLSALKGKFSVSGPSLAAVGDPLSITLPTTPSFKTHGELTKEGAVWTAQVQEASIGSSRLEGDFTYDPRPKTPLLSGRLAGRRLVLADLGPTIGAPPPENNGKTKTKRKGKVIPDKQFDLPSLRAMDADLAVDIAEFDTGTDVLASLKPLKAHLLLADGVLTIADIEAATAKGKLIGSLQLDGREKIAKWKADLGLRGVDLAQWLRIERKGNAPPYLAGKLDAKVKVAGQGRSTAEILGSLGGDVQAHMRNAAISHLAIEALGVDVAQALGILIKGDDLLRIQCNVIDLQVERGLIKPKLLVFTTADSTVWMDGLISLKTESMGIKVAVAPKDFSPLTLRTPIEISGTLSDPSVSLELGKLAGKGVAAGLLALLNPLAAIIPFIDTGSEDEAKQASAQCAAVARRSGATAKPTLRPDSTRVPAAAKLAKR
ncbi:MAG: AsmA family protein [Burkholderiales bacterium]